jgi:RNA polymerase sigma factor (sigma-70 family)
MRTERAVDRVTHDVSAPAHCRDDLAGTYEVLAPQLRRFAGARLRDAEAAEDVVQEAFLRLAVESRVSAEPDKVRAWLYRVVTNLIISGARHSAVARRHALLTDGNEVTFESPETMYIESERYDELDTALAILGVDNRRGVVLAAQGYSGREIALILGLSTGATRTMLCRARRTVAREMDANATGASANAG